MQCDPFFNQLTAEETQHGYFQQDNTTAHTANATMVAIQEVFEDRIISRGLWPPRFPDLSLLRIYLWRNLKEKVYKNNPRSIEALQAEITCIIGSIAMHKLQKVSHNLFMRCEACLCYLFTAFLEMCACKETDVRESPNDSTLAGRERHGNRGETCHPIYYESPFPPWVNTLYKNVT
jgi:hypothetical protein